MEQDKPTLVPAVLNDLVDVDGTPSLGDTLHWNGTAWVPGEASGDGYMVNVYNFTQAVSTPHTTSFTPQAPVDDHATWNGYGGVIPEAFGHWEIGAENVYVLDEVGTYDIYYSCSLTLNTSAGDSTLKVQVSTPPIGNLIDGQHDDYFYRAALPTFIGIQGGARARVVASTQYIANSQKIYPSGYWWRDAAQTATRTEYMYVVRHGTDERVPDYWATVEPNV